MNTTMFSLGWRDIAKGFVVAVIGALLNYVYPVIVNHMLPDWQSTAYVAAIAGVGYLLKNYFSTSDGKVAGIVG